MKFTNEKQLVLYFSQVRLNKADLERIIELCKHPIDWKFVIETAVLNGVELILYNNLQKLNQYHEIPLDIMESLKKAYLSNTAKNMYLGYELCRLLKEFKRKSIDVIVLKGAALAHIVYPNCGLRKYRDIDILIKKDDRQIVEKLVSEFAYVSTEDLVNQQHFKETCYHLAPYIHVDRNIILEIHWNITNKFNIDINGWWNRAVKSKILKNYARVLCPDDLLKHLCIHTSKHGFKNIDLRDLCDITETIKCFYENIDWERFQQEVDSYPIRTEVYSILYCIKSIFFNNANYLNWLTYKKADLKLVSLLEELIFSSDRDRVCPNQISSVILENSFKGKVKVVANKFFPHREFMTKRYSLPSSSPKIYFYYLMRPLMLLINKRKYIGQFIIYKAKEVFIKTSYTLRKIS
jgi:hypothetical protein